MRRVVEGSHQGVVVRTKDAVLFINDGFARLIGYDDAAGADGASGQAAINDFIHPDDRKLIVDRIDARMAGHEVVSHYEFRMIHRDGSHRVDRCAGRARQLGRQAGLAVLADRHHRAQGGRRGNACAPRRRPNSPTAPRPNSWPI